MNKYRIVDIVSDASSSSYYRNILPVTHCKQELANHNIELTNKFVTTNDNSSLADCYIFSRIPAATMFPFIRKLHKNNRKIIWDIDDEIWNIPEWNPSSKFFIPEVCDYLDYYFSISTKIIVSTENIAFSVLRKHEDMPEEKVLVLENLIDRTPYDKFININKCHNDTPFKIIWSGGYSHLRDVEPICEIYDLYKNNENVNIIMFGYTPERLDKPEITSISWGERKNYVGTLCMLSPHIALIPLECNQFNSCKSAIKYYEMSLAGIPSIVSDINTYTFKMCNQESGLIASQCSDWLSHCEHLRENRAIWEKIQDGAFENVINNYSWNVSNKLNRAWLEFFKSIPDL